MRISDWSSDVCSSDLPTITETRIVPDLVELPVEVAKLLSDALDEGPDIRPIAFLTLAGGETLAMHQIVDLAIADVPAGVDGQVLDRKSVVSGKSVYVRVDLGGRRFIKKKTNHI